MAGLCGEQRGSLGPTHKPPRMTLWLPTAGEGGWRQRRTRALCLLPIPHQSGQSVTPGKFSHSWCFTSFLPTTSNQSQSPLDEMPLLSLSEAALTPNPTRSSNTLRGMPAPPLPRTPPPQLHTSLLAAPGAPRTPSGCWAGTPLVPLPAALSHSCLSQGPQLVLCVKPRPLTPHTCPPSPCSAP